MPEPPANRAQMALLMCYMKKNKDMAKGIITKAHSKNRWEEIAAALNEKGPPTKDWQKWNRVWINFKAKTKAKLAENRTEIRAPLKSLMEEILELRRPVTTSRQIFEIANVDDMVQQNIQEMKTENEYEDSTSKDDCLNSVWQEPFELINLEELPRDTETKPDTRANRAQMALLIGYMKRNKDMAKGIITKAHSKKRWEIIAADLNSKGPPTKDWQKWNRVWINYKAKAKAKLTENRNEIEVPLKSVTEDILELRDPVTTSSQVFEIKNVNDIAQQNIQVMKSENEYEEASTITADFSNSVWQEAFELINLEEFPNEHAQTSPIDHHIGDQEKLEEVFVKHASIEKSLRELVELKKEELNILRRENRQKEIYRMKKLSILERQIKKK